MARATISPVPPGASSTRDCRVAAQGAGAAASMQVRHSGSTRCWHNPKHASQALQHPPHTVSTAAANTCWRSRSTRRCTRTCATHSWSARGRTHTCANAAGAHLDARTHAQRTAGVHTDAPQLCKHTCPQTHVCCAVCLSSSHTARRNVHAEQDPQAQVHHAPHALKDNPRRALPKAKPPRGL